MQGHLFECKNLLSDTEHFPKHGKSSLDFVLGAIVRPSVTCHCWLPGPSTFHHLSDSLLVPSEEELWLTCKRDADFSAGRALGQLVQVPVSRPLTPAVRRCCISGVTLCPCPPGTAQAYTYCPNVIINSIGFHSQMHPSFTRSELRE